MTLKRRLFLVSPLFLVLLLGCSGGGSGRPARVSGAVMYKGTALTAGSISFYAAEGRPAGTAYITPEGTYSLADLPTGDLTVTVETESANPKHQVGANQYGAGRGKTVTHPSGLPEGVTPPEAAKGNYVKIPPRYADPKKSQLTVTLASGNQTKNIDLTE
jgi:hypothetical protein